MTLGEEPWVRGQEVGEEGGGGSAWWCAHGGGEKKELWSFEVKLWDYLFFGLKAFGDFGQSVDSLG